MKKIIITLLLAVTLMLGVTACSSKEEPKPATTSTPEVTKAEVTDVPVDVTEPTNVEPAVTDVVEPIDVDVTPEITAEPTPTEMPTEWTFTKEDLFGAVEPVTDDYEIGYGYNTIKDKIAEKYTYTDENGNVDIEKKLAFKAISLIYDETQSISIDSDLTIRDISNRELIRTQNIESKSVTLGDIIDDVSYKYTTPDMTYTYTIVTFWCEEGATSEEIRKIANDYVDVTKQNANASTDKILRTKFIGENYAILPVNSGEPVLTAKDIAEMTDLNTLQEKASTNKSYLAVVEYNYVNALGIWNIYDTSTCHLTIYKDAIDAYYAE